MPRPIVAIVGRPNVGKSALFNRLLGEQQAVVYGRPGTTRDRVYGTAEWDGREFTLVDTGGMDVLASTPLGEGVMAQARMAVAEADVVLLLVDVASGLLPSDHEVADVLRRSGKPVLVVANKADNPRLEAQAAEFFSMGLGEPLAVSALRGLGIGELLDALTAQLPAVPSAAEEPVALRLAIVGRPNVGKSSLLNAILGQPRALVSEVPGTTRDALDTLMEVGGRRALVVDTAGLRRRGRVEPGVEKYSALRAMRAIDRSDVVALVLEGPEGPTAQDAHLAGYARDLASGLVLVVNKWDLVPSSAEFKREYELALRRQFDFVQWAPALFVSAKTGRGVGKVLEVAFQIQGEREKRVPTSIFNAAVREAVAKHVLVERGRSLKFLYATQAAVNPPTFVFFVNDPGLMHFSYERYLENQIREKFGLAGTGMKLVFRRRGE